MIHLNVPVVKHVTASVLMMILNADPVLVSTAPVTARPASAGMIVRLIYVPASRVPGTGPVQTVNAHAIQTITGTIVLYNVLKIKYM